MKRQRVMVIEDDPLFRSLIVSMIRQDYIVSVASDGSEGFYKALEFPPTVAIIDVQMPVWNGLKTLKAFRSHAALRHVKLVVLTADASKETVLAAIREGADDYLIKTSFSKEEFRSKLAKLTDPNHVQGRPTRRSMPSPKSELVAKLESEKVPVEASVEWNTDDMQATLDEMIDDWE